MTTILVATDFSHEALCAARWAASLGQLLHSQGEQVRLVFTYVVPVEALPARQVVSARSEEQELTLLAQELQEWISELQLDGVEVLPKVHVGSARRTLPDLVREYQADWLVLGQTGKGRLAKIFLGTTAEQIALNPPCPTVLVKDVAFPWDGGLRIFSSLDLRPSSYRAAARAADTFAPLSPEITLAHVVDLPKMGSGLIDSNTLPETISSYLSEATSSIEKEIQTSWDELTSEPTPPHQIELRPGYPTHELLYLIEEMTPDLITIGVNHHSALSRFFLGSVGHGILRQGLATYLLFPYSEPETPS